MEEEKIALAAGASNGLYDSGFSNVQEYYIDENLKDEKYLSEERKAVTVLIHEDQFEQRYLDVYTLAALTGRTQFTDFHYEDGQVVSASTNFLLNHPAPDGYEYSERRMPDFSDLYPFNTELGLYELTDEQIAELVENYRRMHPEVDVHTEIKKVELKNINVDKNDKNYSELANMFDDGKTENNIGEDKVNNVK